MAKEVASWSKDPKKKVGAVLVRDKRVLSTGYNGFPTGISDDFRLDKTSEKLSLVIHAELNAILNAGKHGVSTEGATLYVTYPPCNHCSLSIIQAGIQRVVMPRLCPVSSWFTSQVKGLESFTEAGVAFWFL